MAVENRKERKFWQEERRTIAARAAQVVEDAKPMNRGE